MSPEGFLILLVEGRGPSSGGHVMFGKEEL